MTLSPRRFASLKTRRGLAVPSPRFVCRCRSALPNGCRATPAVSLCDVEGNISLIEGHQHLSSDSSASRTSQHIVSASCDIRLAHYTPDDGHDADQAQVTMAEMEVSVEAVILGAKRVSKQTDRGVTKMRLRGLYTMMSHGILAPEGCLSIFCAHLGNACTQVRRSSVACKGVTSASVLGRYPSVLPHSVVPRIGYASCSSRATLIASQEA